MVKLHGIEIPLENLPMICYCGQWCCPNSYRGKKSTLLKLKKAKAAQQESE